MEERQNIAIVRSIIG
jgi:hypothetical protein